MSQNSIHLILDFSKPVDTRVLLREETGKKSLKIVMFDSQEYPQDRSHGLKREKINIQEFRPGH